MATWVIGDIHGCYEALLLLEQAVLEVDADASFVSVGDLIDRGPQSREVVEHFRSSDRHAAVMGNHEEFLLRVVGQERPDLFEGINMPGWVEPTSVVLGRKARRLDMGTVADWQVNSRLMWLLQGGVETLESYGADPTDPASWSLPRDHLEWMAGLPLMWQDDDVVVTHALVGRDDLEALRGAGDVQREVAAKALWSRVPPDQAPDTERMHVSGHTVRARVFHHEGLRLVQLDTGAYLAGRLTAYCAPLDAVIGVPSEITWEMA